MKSLFWRLWSWLKDLQRSSKSSKIFEIFKTFKVNSFWQFLSILSSQQKFYLRNCQVREFCFLKNFFCFHWLFILFVRWNIRILLFFALIVKHNYTAMACRISCTYIHFVYGLIWESCDEDVFIFIIKQILRAFILTRVLWL